MASTECLKHACVHVCYVHKVSKVSLSGLCLSKSCIAQEAVRLRQNYADAYTGWGVSLKELKRKEEAEHCFAQVVRLRPHCALSLGNLAGKLQLLCGKPV